MKGNRLMVYERVTEPFIVVNSLLFIRGIGKMINILAKEYYITKKRKSLIKIGIIKIFPKYLSTGLNTRDSSRME